MASASEIPKEDTEYDCEHARKRAKGGVRRENEASEILVPLIRAPERVRSSCCATQHNQISTETQRA